MVDEGNAVYFHFPCKLGGIRINNGIPGMHQGVKAENKIKRVPSDHAERWAVIDVVADMEGTCKTFTACLDAIF